MTSSASHAPAAAAAAARAWGGRQAAAGLSTAVFALGVHRHLPCTPAVTTAHP